MKIVSVAQMRELESAALATGLTEQDLVNAAGAGIAAWLAFDFPEPAEFVFFCGKGNNGADGFAAAAILAAEGRAVRCVSPYTVEGREAEPADGARVADAPHIVLVDALLGIGVKGPLRREIRQITEGILQHGRSPVVAIDVPTGLDADTGEEVAGAVSADVTITCGLPKNGLFTDRALDRVGRLRVAPLPVPEPAVDALKTPGEFFARDEAGALLKRRRWSSHKGDHGRVHVVAGALGMSGAAVMAIEGALRGGAGLVYAWTPRDVQAIVAGAVPEAMVLPFDNFGAVLAALPKDAALVIGPGLGTPEGLAPFLKDVLARRDLRVVLDADALNAIATNRDLFAALHEGVLLTPHPGEMARLLGSGDFGRVAAAMRFMEAHPAALLLKGAATLVAQRGRALSVNGSGNPGLAHGGMGDVLAGLCGALLADGYSPFDAARLGAFLHGLAADLCLGGQSPESLLPRDVLAALGSAFQSIRSS